MKPLFIILSILLQAIATTLCWCVDWRIGVAFMLLALSSSIDAMLSFGDRKPGEADAWRKLIHEVLDRLEKRR